MTKREMASVVVIGAGISGLCAAKILKEHGIQVIVLEARSRVGGRTLSVEVPGCGQSDVGGAYIGPNQRRIARLAKTLGLHFHKVYNDGYTLTSVQSFKARFTGLIPPIYNPIVVLDVNHTLRKLNTLAENVPSNKPWDAPLAREWDCMTVKEFLDKTCWTRLSKATVKLMLKSLLCVEEHQVSLLAFLWYIKSGQGLQTLTQVAEGAQEQKITEGSQAISHRLAELLNGSVKLNEPAIRVKQSEKGVIVDTASGKSYQADFVVSAVPLPILNRIEFVPTLPPLKLQLIQNMPMGSIIKTITFYEDAFWRKNGFNGQIASDDGPVIYCIDDTKPDGSHPAIMGFILAEHARELVTLTEEQRKRRVCEHYAHHFNSELFLRPIKYIEHNWMSEQYSGGCYVSTFPPGILTSFSRELKSPFRHVFFAGTETATEWAGYMDGAVQAGERAAREVLHALGRVGSEDIDEEEPQDPDFPDRNIKPSQIEYYLPTVGTLLAVLVSFVALLISLLGLYMFNDI